MCFTVHESLGESESKTKLNLNLLFRFTVSKKFSSHWLQRLKCFKGIVRFCVCVDSRQKPGRFTVSGVDNMGMPHDTFFFLCHLSLSR